MEVSDGRALTVRREVIGNRDCLGQPVVILGEVHVLARGTMRLRAGSIDGVGQRSDVAVVSARGLAGRAQ